jgi:aromatic ring-opening dioxygenase catalytic subunit (LigB family)
MGAIIDTKRGWDHGVFVPLIMLAPEATIPVVQLSVLQSQNAKELLKMGEALAPLLDEGIALVGSGYLIYSLRMSFHNMRLLRGGEPTSSNGEFECELKQASELPYDERMKKLAVWRSMKGAAECHPEGATEHFSPYLVVSGAAKSGTLASHSTHMMGFEVSAYCWK